MAGAECPKTVENREGVILFDLLKKKPTTIVKMVGLELLLLPWLPFVEHGV